MDTMETFFNKDLISILYKHSPLMSMQLFSLINDYIQNDLKKKSHMFCAACALRLSHIYTGVQKSESFSSPLSRILAYRTVCFHHEENLILISCFVDTLLSADITEWFMILRNTRQSHHTFHVYILNTRILFNT